MKMKLFVFFFSILIVSCGSGSRLMERYGVREIRMMHNGRERTCLIHVPVGKLTGRLPLVLVLHGGGGTAAGMIKLTRNRFNELADVRGFYAAYPQGIRKHWNDFRDDPIDYAHRERIDDSGFISALIDRLAAEYPIDPDRVFATGISNGGFMSYRLGCELSPKIRGIAPVAATLPAGADKKCKPAKPVNVVIINGTDDPLVPFNGGYVTVLGRRRGEILSTEDTVRFWTRADECTSTPATGELPDRDPDDGTRVKEQTFGTCGRGVRVVLYRVEGGGHTWPGGKQYLSRRFIGNTSYDFNACDVIWEFFSSSR
jgi:polyhydroxybutyrate depolymerase